MCFICIDCYIKYTYHIQLLNGSAENRFDIDTWLKIRTACHVRACEKLALSHDLVFRCETISKFHMEHETYVNVHLWDRTINS